MRTTNSVCYGCTRRTATCHATCPDGKAEEERNRQKRQEAVKKRQGSYGMYDTRRVNRALRDKERKEHWNY